MAHTTEHFVTPYVETDLNRYEYTFTSAHKFIIYQTVGRNMSYMGCFKGINGTSGEIGLRNTPQEVLDEFNKLLATDTIRPDIMEGFKM